MASIESSSKQILKLIGSVIIAFVGFSFAFIVVMSFGFLRILAIKAGDNTLPDGISLVDALSSAGLLAVVYGLLFLIALAVPFFVIAVPAALIGWKLKILRWWVCLIGGGLFFATPIALMLTPVTLAFFLRGGSLFSGDMFDIISMFLGSIFCGSMSGLCFWSALRLLRFSDITGPIAYPIQFSR